MKVLQKMDNPGMFAVSTALLVTPVVLLFLFGLQRLGLGGGSSAN